MSGPVIVSTWSFGQRANNAAWPTLQRNGSALDAVEQACCAVERDPQVDSVGFGGLPDASGEVSLDASIMLAPGRCGSVTYVRKYLEVTSIARRVMERTAHRMLSGDGAERFAAAQGFRETNLLCDEARAKWEQWRDNPSASLPDQSKDSGLGALRPVDRDGSGQLFRLVGGDETRWHDAHDTIGTLALDAEGILAGACSTSGTPYKTPGRIGDSPIVGAGLYVAPEVGAATATGTGELIMDVCGSFLIVELMRQGVSPHDAIAAALQRIGRTHTLRPNDQAAFIALRPDGSFASGALRSGFKVAIRHSNRDDVCEPDLVLRDD